MIWWTLSVRLSQTMDVCSIYRPSPTSMRSAKAFEKDSKRFLDLLLMQDKLLGTRSEFRLGHWTEAARSLGTTEAEKDQYEWNARTQITTWGNRVCADDGGLRDYAHKEWNGILKDFYYKRWSTYFASLEDQLNGKPKVDIDFYSWKNLGLNRQTNIRQSLRAIVWIWQKRPSK